MNFECHRSLIVRRPNSKLIHESGNLPVKDISLTFGVKVCFLSDPKKGIKGTFSLHESAGFYFLSIPIWTFGLWKETRHMHYPLMLNLNGCTCLVVGAGQVGRRKATEVMKSGSKVIFIDESQEPSDFIDDLTFRTGIPRDEIGQYYAYHHRAFDVMDLNGITLCFLCTTNREHNSEISKLCAERSIMTNVADCPDEGNFIVPSIRRIEPITLAVYCEDNPAASRFLADYFIGQMTEGFRQFVKHTWTIRQEMKKYNLPSLLRQKIMKTIYGQGVVKEALEHDSPELAIARANQIFETYKTENDGE